MDGLARFCRQRRCFQCQLKSEQGKRYLCRQLLSGCVPSWKEKSFGIILCSVRDQTHKLMLNLCSICPFSIGPLFRIFEASALDPCKQTSWTAIFMVDWGVHTAPCEGRSSLVWTGYCCPCPLFLVGKVFLCVFLGIFNVSCCREAAASSVVLEDVYSTSLRAQEE